MIRMNHIDMDSLIVEQSKKYPFELDEFQTKALIAIERGDRHVLVCAPTGSGKSMVAQHATDWGLRSSKRVIYTTPIKSLSNQAYASLAKHFGADTVGIMTGDNQYNPNARVLIMTTEILRNFLLDGKTRKHSTQDEYLYMDVAKDVAVVVFDEVHYLQDPHRGYVWETCFVRMPLGISMIMLSATIENPDMLVSWLETIKETKVELCVHSKRSVPLQHCLFTHLHPTHQTLPDASLHAYKNRFEDVSHWSIPELERFVKPITEHYKWFQTGSVAIEGCVRYLKDNEMLPALCFVLSRKRCESLCASWSVGLLEEGEAAQVYRDWRRIVREATRGDTVLLTSIEALPQYRMLTESLQKGVAFHHSGVIPVLKECVEMLMKEGRIPCIFATETFAVGINSPTRTVIMSQIDKRQEAYTRCLEPHEYIQMGGRAGRRGLDTVGYVVTLPVGFVKRTTAMQYHRILHGDPVHIGSTQIIPAVQVLRHMASMAEDSSISKIDLLDGVGKRSMRSYEIDCNMESKNHCTISQCVVQLTPEEKEVWAQWEALKKKPEKTQGQQKRKTKKIAEWRASVNVGLFESAELKMKEKMVQKEETEANEAQCRELETVLESRLGYLCDLGMVQVVASGYALTELGRTACMIQQGNPCHTAFILGSLGRFVKTDDVDPLYLLCFASLFLTPSETQENGCEPAHRECIGHLVMSTIEEASRNWDVVAQVHSCWESNEISYELLLPLWEVGEATDKEFNYFTLQRTTGWQEGRLWKSMNDLVSVCGELQEVWGYLGYVGLYKKMGEAQVMAKGATLMIPSLYLQPVSYEMGLDCGEDDTLP